ncbi:antirestriction protein ArdA [Flavobacterium alkalisoli]|uniref:antirestriction protein ArdA n=1 Tax=Flavobacterium alkalisoli TaxID=2602769 RepID=UPI003A915602
MNVNLELWLGCEASYGDGFLFDKKYIVSDSSELDDAKEDFKKHVIESIGKARPDWVNDGYVSDSYAEELYIADYELTIDDIFIEPDNGESLYDMGNLLETIENNSVNNPIDLLIAWAKNTGQSLDEVISDDEISYYELDENTHHELGYVIAHETGIFDNDSSQTLKDYFDYESYGRDLELGGDFTIIETDNNTYAVMG